MFDTVLVKFPMCVIFETPIALYGVVGDSLCVEARNELFAVEFLNVESVACLAERVVTSHVDKDSGFYLHVHVAKSCLSSAFDIGVFKVDACSVGNRDNHAA